MAIFEKLSVKHTVDMDHRPVAAVVNFPRLDTELSPDQLRALSVVLARAADECEALAQECRSYGPERREYPLEVIDSAVGMAWWNNLSESERAQALRVAKTAVPAEAYHHWLARTTLFDAAA